MTNLQTPAPARDSRENEMSLDRNNFFIGNEWVRPASDRRFKIHNASTGEHVATVPEGVEADVDAAVAAARQAFDHSPWPRLKPAERADIMLRFMAELVARGSAIAEAVSLQNGMPVTLANMLEAQFPRSAEHTSELQSLIRTSY